MSFLSVLKSIGHGVQTGLGVEQQFAPIVAAVPGGSVVNTVVYAILSLEQLFPHSGLGPAKSQLVTAAAIAAAPGIDPGAVQASVSQIVAAFNALQNAAASKPAT